MDKINLSGTIFGLFEDKKISIDEREEKNKLLNIRFGNSDIIKKKFSDLDVKFPYSDLKRYFSIVDKGALRNYNNDEAKYYFYDNEVIDDNDVLKEIKIIRIGNNIGNSFKDKEILIFIFESKKVKILYTGNISKKHFYPNFYDYFLTKYEKTTVTSNDVTGFLVSPEAKFGIYEGFTELNKPYISSKYSDDENIKKINEKVLGSHYVEVYTFNLLSSNGGSVSDVNYLKSLANIKYGDLKEIVVGYETDEEQKEIKQDEYWADKIDSSLKPINFIFDPSEDDAYYYEVKYKGKTEKGEEKEFVKYTNGLSREDASIASKGADILGYFGLHTEDVKFESSKKDSDKVEDGEEIYKTYVNVKSVETSSSDTDTDKPDEKVVQYKNGKIVYNKENITSFVDEPPLEDDLVSDAGPTTGKLEKLPAEDMDFISNIIEFEGFIPYFYFCPVGALTYGFGQTRASSTDDDQKLFEKAEGRFGLNISKTIGETTVTPKMLEGHLRLVVGNGIYETKNSYGKIVRKVNINGVVCDVITFKGYNIIANTRLNFYNEVIVKSFGVNTLENFVVEWEKGADVSNWESKITSKLKSTIKTKKDYVVYLKCYPRFIEALNKKTVEVFRWLINNVAIEELNGYSYTPNIEGLKKVIDNDAGPASIFKFITQKQFEDLINTKYQGHGSIFWGPISGDSSQFGDYTYPVLGDPGKYTFKYRKSLSENSGKSNYVVFCKLVCDLIDRANEAIAAKKLPDWYYRKESNRKDIISHFTLSKEKEAAYSNYYSQQVEKNKLAAEANSIGTVNIDTITITAISNRKFTIVSSYKQVNKDAIDKAEIEKSAVHYVELEKLTEEYSNALAEALNNPLGGENTVDWEKEKKFMNRWSINYDKKSEDFEQVFIDVDKYYDFYSGMTPYIEVHFRDNDGKNWNVINSVDHPYIKSLQVVDKGVKKITLQLFDKDFASYQAGVLKTFDNISYDTSEEKQKALEEANVNNKYSKNIEELKSYRKKQKAADNAKRQVYSLDTLIKRSLMTINEKEDEKGKETYGEDPQSDLETGYLKISEYNKSVGPGNLKIRYGYCDDNPNFSTNTAEKNYNSKSSTTADQTGLVKTKNVNIGENDIGNRTNRWWDVRTGTSGDSYSLIWEHKIEGDKLVDGRTTLNNGVSQVRALAQKDIGVGDDDKQETINDKSTLKSYLQEYMIVGYKTTLANNGILYTIEGIEVKDVEVMKKRFLQRYAEVSSYPLEVLYVLMRIFNESENNKIIDNGVKILYLNDDPYFNNRPTDSFNMDFDFSGLNENDITKAQDKFRDVYWANKKGEHFSDKYLKKINLNFGSEGALVNYSLDSKKPLLYKSLDSLIGEFCSACPTRKEYNDDEGVGGYDKDGNEIKNEGYKAAQTLSWMTTKNFDKNDKTVYIILYYKKIRKLKTIKKYTWGPNNPNKHIVKRIQIQNNNEFALLSSVTTTKFDGSVLVSETINNKDNNDSKEEVVSSIMRGEKLIKDYENENKGYMTTYAAEGTNASNNIERALKMSMYNGTMELLGDPGLEFNLKVQPYMYPIYLDVLIPINDLYFNPTYKKEIEKYDQIYGSIGNKKLGNQKRHELSGFYVITEITHNISSSGYTTTIGVSKYPKIEDDILTDTTKSKIRYNKS